MYPGFGFVVSRVVVQVLLAPYSGATATTGVAPYSEARPSC